MELRLTRNSPPIQLPRRRPAGVTPPRRREPFTPTPPRVNLLSAEVTELVTAQMLRKRFTGAWVLLVAVIAVSWSIPEAQVVLATAHLRSARNQTHVLAGQVARMRPVQDYYAAVAKDAATVSTVMRHEVLFSTVVGQLHADVPAGVSIQDVTVTANVTTTSGPTPPAAAVATTCPGADPFTTAASIGCATISGRAVSRAAVGAFLTALAHDSRFVDPYVSSTNVDGSGNVAFAATVGLTDKAYSGRYTNPAAAQGAAR